ncbi:MAG: metal-sensing transcriptional repressor [Succinivibrio sp.]
MDWTEHDDEGAGHFHAHDHPRDHGASPHAHLHTNTRDVLNRISRLSGHLASIKRMIESGRDCSEVLVQLSAVDSAIRSTMRVILKEHLQTCIVDAVKTGDKECLEELADSVDRFMK